MSRDLNHRRLQLSGSNKINRMDATLGAALGLLGPVVVNAITGDGL